MASTAHARWQDTAESSALRPTTVVGSFPEDMWLHLRASWQLSEQELRIIQEICSNEELEGIPLVPDVPSEVVYRTLQRLYIKLGIGGRRELNWRVQKELVATQSNIDGPIAA